ncbi:MAG: hypothetical protein EHM61_10145 [Acidobacteria bacterium]|nr:MAG: hypothetical protein EHM61_10145 [Acidobacteriota bacterium]
MVSAGASFQVGEWAVYPQLNKIERGEESRRLEPKVMDVLSYLAEHAGEVLTREKLFEAVWTDTCVGDEVLTYSIKQLRRAVGDDAHRPRYIETIPRRGYRLVAAVSFPENRERGSELKLPPVGDDGQAHQEEVGSLDSKGSEIAIEGGPQVSQAPEESGKRKPRTRRIVWYTAALLAVAFLVAVSWWLLTSTRESATVLSAIPFTTYHGYEGRPTFSPDGNQVAFQWNGEKEDNEDIYVKSVGSEKPLRLTSDPAIDAGPSWSPDGSYIAFLRFANSRVAVFTVPPVGGVERKVYETNYVWKAELSGRKLICAPDGRRFVISERDSPSDPNALFLVSMDTGERLRLTSPPVGFEGDSDPVFSPDGKILTFSRKRAVDSDDLFMIELDADFKSVGEARPLTTRMPVKSRNFVGHAWGNNENEIVASLAYAANRFDLWRIRLDDPQAATRLEFIGEGGTFPVISRSAGRIVYEKGLSTVSIWSLEDSRESKRGPVQTRLLSSTQWDNQCQVSPSGEKIAFRSARSGFSEVCSSNSNGSGFLWLTRYNGPSCGSPAWSPDSRLIAYDARPEGHSDIYVVSAEGGPARRITDDTGEDIMPTWSRDGRWIYVTSNRTGSWQVWKTPAEGGEPVQVTRNGGFYGLESLDGKTLFYGKRLNELGIYRMPVEGGEEAVFLADALATGFAQTATGYYFWTPDRALTFLDSSSATRRIVAFVDRPPAPFLSVFPDGRHIVYSLVDQSSSDLYLVNNFR